MTLDVPVDCMFEQLGDIIYSRTTIDKQNSNQSSIVSIP